MSLIVNTRTKPSSRKSNRAIATICAGDPNGFQLRRIECAHQVKREDADRSSVTEDRDPPTLVLLNDLVEFSRRAIEQLTITLAARQDVFEVAAKQRLRIVPDVVAAASSNVRPSITPTLRSRNAS